MTVDSKYTRDDHVSKTCLFRPYAAESGRNPVSLSSVMSTPEAVFNSATDTVNDLADRNVDSTESDVRVATMSTRL